LPSAAPGWFWTDHSYNLQFVGRCREKAGSYAAILMRHKALMVCLRNGVIVGITLNQGRAMRLLRKWIQAKRKSRHCGGFSR
jgi:3-phenylpropionate/trans-cinnamate dioxygenase ferredoxin reductase subunit